MRDVWDKVATACFCPPWSLQHLCSLDSPLAASRFLSQTSVSTPLFHQHPLHQQNTDDEISSRCLNSIPSFPSGLAILYIPDTTSLPRRSAVAHSLIVAEPLPKSGRDDPEAGEAKNVSFLGGRGILAYKEASLLLSIPTS